VTELNIHIRLREARKSLDLNQLIIAEDLNIQQKTVSEIENGNIINIPNKYIYYFFKKGISLEWIYDGSGTMMKFDQNKTTSDVNLENTLDKLFDKMDSVKDQSSVYDIKESRGSAELKTEIGSVNMSDLLNSKDYNIKSLLSYVKSQEKMIDFLQQIVKKELKL